MPYTVHTLDGQAHTYPDTSSACLACAGLLTIHEGVPHVDEYGETQYAPMLAMYPAGQWTHYHVEPVPYETDYSSTDAARDTQDQADVTKGMTANAEAWAAQFQSHLEAGRKAARAR